VEHGLELEAQGASILDVGGESTRPGAAPVAADEEQRRVLPVVRGLAARSGARISVDTSKASVARAALDAGASIVNDVRAGEADAEMVPLVARRGCDYVLMHTRGTPRDMQDDPRYDDAPSEVLDYLRRRVAHCLRSGVDPTKIVVDPGIGFGKRLEHNISLLRRLPELRSLGRPLLVGVSRKSFIGHITDRPEPKSRASSGGRLGGTAAAVTVSVLAGAQILRVHDVAVMAETVRVAEALRPGSASIPSHAPTVPR
jgi:dihydropteroate synthase